MMHQLKRSAKLKNLAGLILGGFTDMKDTERPFGKTIEELLLDQLLANAGFIQIKKYQDHALNPAIDRNTHLLIYECTK